MRHRRIASASDQAPFGIERDACLGKALGQCRHGFDFGLPAEHAALELEVGKAVARVRGLGEAHDRLRRQGVLVAQARPVVRCVGVCDVRKIGAPPVTDVKEIPQHRHLAALDAIAEKCRHRHLEMLAEQVEQRRFEGGHCMHGGAQVEGLFPAAAGITICESLAHFVEHGLHVADRAADDDRASVFQCLADALAARHLAHAGAARAVGDDD